MGRIPYYCQVNCQYNYVVVVDRYSNWPMVYRAENGADGLIKRLREVFATFGVPEEITSDGGPQFTAGKTQHFLNSWGIHHRLTSVANPRANCRAEIAVKTSKRLLMDNTASNGAIDVDKFQKAMLIYRNTVDPATRTSPALAIFGRPIRDSIPIPMGRYCPHSTWQETLAYREQALAKRHTREQEKWNQHTRPLPSLKVGDNVYIQNLTGNHPKRWERTGRVVEVRQFHQYVVKVDGSGRLTLRNRQHLRKFTPFNTMNRENLIESLLTPPSQANQSDNVTPMPFDDSQVSKKPLTLSPQPPCNDVPDTESDYETEVPPIEQENLPPQQQEQPKKLPRALARLQPHNSPGTTEVAPTGRLRGRPDRH